METTAPVTGMHDMFATPSEVAVYVKKWGRREVEVALSSGQLSVRAERAIADWLAQEDKRARRNQARPIWALAAVALVGALIGAWLV